MKTIVYGDGGDKYFGEHEVKPLGYWKKFGKKRGYKFLYKGYRVLGGKRDIVVVFDNELWDKKEIEKRRKNGFLGIRCYELRKSEEDEV